MVRCGSLDPPIHLYGSHCSSESAANTSLIYLFVIIDTFLYVPMLVTLIHGRGLLISFTK